MGNSSSLFKWQCNHQWPVLLAVSIECRVICSLPHQLHSTVYVPLDPHWEVICTVMSHEMNSTETAKQNEVSFGQEMNIHGNRPEETEDRSTYFMAEVNLPSTVDVSENSFAFPLIVFTDSFSNWTVKGYKTLQNPKHRFPLTLWPISSNLD